MTVPAPAAAAAPAPQPAKAAGKRPPVEEDEAPRRGKSRPEPQADYEEVEDEPRRPAKKRAEPEADYEEVEEPPRAKKRAEPEEDYEEEDEPRRRPKGRADRDEEDEDRPRRGAKGRDRDDLDEIDDEDDRPKRGAKGRDRDEIDEIDDEDDQPKRKASKVAELPQLETTPEERSAAFMFWILMFIPCISPFASIIWWVMKKKDMPLVDHQGKQMFNFWLTSFVVCLALGIGGGILSTVGYMINSWLGLGINGLVFLVLMAYMVMTLVWTIMAMLKAKNGVWWRIPHTIQLFKTGEPEPAKASKKRAPRDEDEEEFED
jgi:uncharacterized Tic20 family protein